MNLETPKNWRKGQTIFNFLWWLRSAHGYDTEIGAKGRMADPFHISDKDIDKLFGEFLDAQK